VTYDSKCPISVSSPGAGGSGSHAATQQSRNDEEIHQTHCGIVRVIGVLALMIPPRKLVTIAAFLSGMYPPINIHVRDSIQNRHGSEEEDPKP
jgi:hypothetical protein